MEFIVIFIYVFSLLFIFLFSLGQLHLTLHYIRSKKKTNSTLSAFEELPLVTVQLPVYNEFYVIDRLLDAIGKLTYPKEKLQIQILDDSTDETSEKAKVLADRMKSNGMNIELIHRPDRVGFKAGALQYGLDISTGDYIAIFDADFLPEPDFLMKTIPHFIDPTIGVVQTRWGHINQDYSLLTKLQAFGLNAHFSIEQIGRSMAGSYINFNGTAGVWRKDCIIDAGGWSSDTLTEDLDLSYRAQLKGWHFKYLEDVVAPAELPVLMGAVKSQQFRWNKGAAETAKKNLGNVFRTNLSWVNKLHSTFHLLNSSVFIFLLLAALMSIPMLYIKYQHPPLKILFDIGSVFLIGFFSITFFYWTSVKYSSIRQKKTYFLKTYPLFLSISMGLSLHNSLAVLEGITGFRSDFIRTPKFNIRNRGESWANNKYIKPKINWTTIMEGLLCLYFLFGLYLGYSIKDYGLMIFHIMLAFGFASVFYYSVKPLRIG